MNSVTAAAIETFWRDGVVCLRGVLPVDLLVAMEAPVAEATRREQSVDLTSIARSGDGGGRFVAGVDHAAHQSELYAFAAESPLPRLVAALLRSREVFLYEDSVLVKEPGTVERTVWHQDLGYFHVEGTQVCTTWCPLDPATAESGAMRFARGSHTVDALYRPNLFVTTESIPETEGDEVPDVDAGEYDIVSFDLEPGDITVHHARTLHAAGPNRHPTRARRAISVRYCGDDARMRFRPGAPVKASQRGLRDGDRLGAPAHPSVFRQGMS